MELSPYLKVIQCVHNVFREAIRRLGGAGIIQL